MVSEWVDRDKQLSSILSFKVKLLICVAFQTKDGHYFCYPFCQSCSDWCLRCYYLPSLCHVLHCSFMYICVSTVHFWGHDTFRVVLKVSSNIISLDAYIIDSLRQNHFVDIVSVQICYLAIVCKFVHTYIIYIFDFSVLPATFSQEHFSYLTVPMYVENFITCSHDIAWLSMSQSLTDRKSVV